MDTTVCSGSRNSRRIAMLVDGTVPGQASLMRRLRRDGCAVVAAHSAEEMERLCRRGAVDVAVVPLARAGGERIRLLERLAEGSPEVVGVLLASAPSSQQVAAALELGVVGILTVDADRQSIAAVFGRAWQERQLRRMDRVVRAEEARASASRAASARRFERDLRNLGFRWLRIERLRGQGGGAREAVLVLDGTPNEPVGATWQRAAALGRIDELEEAVLSALADELALHPEWTDVFVDLVADHLLDTLLAAGPGPLAPHAGCLVLGLPREAALWEGGDLALAVERLRAQGFRFCTDEIGLWGARASRIRRLRPEFVRVSTTELAAGAGRSAGLLYLQTLVLTAQRTGAQVLVTGASRPEDRRLAASIGCDLIRLESAEPRDPPAVVDAEAVPVVGPEGPRSPASC